MLKGIRNFVWRKILELWLDKQIIHHDNAPNTARLSLRLYFFYQKTDKTILSFCPIQLYMIYDYKIKICDKIIKKIQHLTQSDDYIILYYIIYTLFFSNIIISIFKDNIFETTHSLLIYFIRIKYAVINQKRKSEIWP